MSKLDSILSEAKKGLKPWEPIPEKAWQNIANQLAEEEINEIEQRKKALNNELAQVPDWDGDTQDDIYKALEFFNEILKLYKKGE